MYGAIIAGCFGLIIGSFLNVLVLRRGASSLGGRSHCMSCGAMIRWYDNVPLLSWLFLRGRCRACGARISIQYPLVELAAGLSFAAVAGAPGLTLPTIVLGCCITALVIAIAAYDILHTIIPDVWVWTFNILCLAYIFLAPVPGDQLFALVAGPIAALPLLALWGVSQGRWMGFGDVKLALGIGWLAGFAHCLYAIMLAFILGAAVSVLILLPLPAVIEALARWGILRTRTLRSYTMKSEVPFGPFLIAACGITWFALLYSMQLPLASAFFL